MNAYKCMHYETDSTYKMNAYNCTHYEIDCTNMIYNQDANRCLIYLIQIETLNGLMERNREPSHRRYLLIKDLVPERHVEPLGVPYPHR